MPATEEERLGGWLPLGSIEAWHRPRMLGGGLDVEHVHDRRAPGTSPPPPRRLGFLLVVWRLAAQNRDSVAADHRLQPSFLDPAHRVPHSGGRSATSHQRSPCISTNQPRIATSIS